MILACDCGQTHEVPGPVADLIADLGPCILVTVPVAAPTDPRPHRSLVRSWRVPRVWIAVHGLKARELAELARRHGWEEATQS